MDIDHPGCIIALWRKDFVNCKECTRSTHRTKEEKNYLETRLKTVEGQVRGVAKMIDEDK